jgi:predicted phage terminase large subunit-like protein
MSVPDLRVLDAALRTDFLTFTHRGVLTLNPGIAFARNWHLDAIAWQLQKVMAGETKRLIINLPPRALKSIMVSVLFPAFWLGHDPRRKIFGISYGSDLSAKHASDFRSVTESEWYKRAFPKMTIARAVDSDVYTTQRGFRKATSINAALTGFGGDCFIIDDPLKPVDAQSDAQRGAVNDWISSTLVSRLDDKEKGVIVVVMQRVHHQDLTGYLLERSPGTWTVLNLPAIAENREQVEVGPGLFHVRNAGDALHPEREPLHVLESLRHELGSDVFAAQYQQCPVPPGGAMIKRAWLRYYDQPPERTYKCKIVQSWDTAGKGAAQNSWSVCTTGLLVDGRFYLLDVTRGHYEYPQLRNTAIALAQRFKPDSILIEDASTGIALAQDLKHAHQYAVRPVTPEKDKVTRLYVQQAKFEAGLVLFPRNAPFLPALEAELLAFPHSKTNDQVDSISQALASPVSKYGSYDTSLNWVMS